MIKQALAANPVRAIRGAGGEYSHLADILQAILLASGNPKGHGQILSPAGSHTHSDRRLACYSVKTTKSTAR